MKTRKEAVEYARRIFPAMFDETAAKDRIDPVPEKKAWHWGRCEIGALMDFIYDGPPKSPEEEIWHEKNLRNTKHWR
jgi:hypothetical protein